MSGSPVAEPTPSPRPPALVSLGNFLFKHRNHVFPFCFLSIVFFGVPRSPLGSPGEIGGLNAVGILLALAGQALRFAVIGLAYIRRGGRAGKVHADELVTEGIFAHSRNPLYVGNVMVFLGLFVVLNSFLGWAVGVTAMLLAYWSLVLAEEDFLRRKFGGAYEKYCREVNRFFPSLDGLGATLRSTRFDWRRVIRKEYGSTWTWISAVIGLLFWERVSAEGFETARQGAQPYLVSWIAVTALYGVARFLKKTGRLVQD